MAGGAQALCGLDHRIAFLRRYLLDGCDVVNSIGLPRMGKQPLQTRPGSVDYLGDLQQFSAICLQAATLVTAIDFNQQLVLDAALIGLRRDGPGYVEVIGHDLQIGATRYQPGGLGQFGRHHADSIGNVINAVFKKIARFLEC